MGAVRHPSNGSSRGEGATASSVVRSKLRRRARQAGQQRPTCHVLRFRRRRRRLLCLREVRACNPAASEEDTMEFDDIEQPLYEDDLEDFERNQLVSDREREFCDEPFEEDEFEDGEPFFD